MSALQHLHWRWLISPVLFFLGSCGERLLLKKNQRIFLWVRLKSSLPRAICLVPKVLITTRYPGMLWAIIFRQLVGLCDILREL